jgi:hypothetical protein
MCKPHYAAWLQYEQTKVEPAAPKAATPPPAAKPAQAPAAAPKPAEAKPAEAPKKENPDGSIDFTPSKK